MATAIDLRTFGDLVRTDPKRATPTLRKMLTLHKGSTLAIAAVFEVAQKTVTRWIARLDLREVADKIQKRENVWGAPPQDGKKRGRPRKEAAAVTRVTAEGKAQKKATKKASTRPLKKSLDK